MGLLHNELARPIPFDDLLPNPRHEVRQSFISLDAKWRTWLEKALSVLRFLSVLVLLRRASNMVHRISSFLWTMGLRKQVRKTPLIET